MMRRMLSHAAIAGLTTLLSFAAQAATTTWTSNPHGGGGIQNNNVVNDVWWSGPIAAPGGAPLNMNAQDTLKIDIVFGGGSGLQLLDNGIVSGTTESLKIKVNAGGGTLGTMVDYSLLFTGARGNFAHANPITGTLIQGAGGAVDFNRDLDYVSTFGDIFFTDVHLELTPRAGGAWLINSVEIGLDAWNIEYLLVPPPIPEPRAYALMLAGLGLVGSVAARRRRR